MLKPDKFEPMSLGPQRHTPMWREIRPRSSWLGGCDTAISAVDDEGKVYRFKLARETKNLLNSEVVLPHRRVCSMELSFPVGPQKLFPSDYLTHAQLFHVFSHIPYEMPIIGVADINGLDYTVRDSRFIVELPFCVSIRNKNGYFPVNQMLPIGMLGQFVIRIEALVPDDDIECHLLEVTNHPEVQQQTFCVRGACPQEMSKFIVIDNLLIEESEPPTQSWISSFWEAIVEV